MSFAELFIVVVVGLFVVGPKRLPEAVKTGFKWFTKIKRAINNARSEFEQQIGADEIRRELHNEEVMKSLEQLKSIKADIEATARDAGHTLEHDSSHDPHGHNDDTHHDDDHHDDYDHEDCDYDHDYHHDEDHYDEDAHHNASPDKAHAPIEGFTDDLDKQKPKNNNGKQPTGDTKSNPKQQPSSTSS